MEGPLGFVEHELVGPSQEDGNGSAFVGATCHLDDLSLSASGDLFNELSESELLGGEVVNMGDRGGLEGLGDEVDLVSVDIFDDHDVLLCEEVERKVVEGVSQDALLHEDHVAAGHADFLHQVEDVLALLLQDAVHRSVVMHDDVVFEVGLWR